MDDNHRILLNWSRANNAYDFCDLHLNHLFAFFFPIGFHFALFSIGNIEREGETTSTMMLMMIKKTQHNLKHYTNKADLRNRFAHIHEKTTQHKKINQSRWRDKRAEGIRIHLGEIGIKVFVFWSVEPNDRRRKTASKITSLSQLGSVA